MTLRRYRVLLALALQLAGVVCLAWPSLRITWFGRSITLRVAPANANRLAYPPWGDGGRAVSAGWGFLNPYSFRKLELRPGMECGESTLPGWQPEWGQVIDGECYLVLQAPQERGSCWQAVSFHARDPGPLPDGQVAQRLRLRFGHARLILRHWTVPDDLWHEAKLEFPLRAQGCTQGSEPYHIGSAVLWILENQTMELRVDEEGNAVLHRIVVPPQEVRLRSLLEKAHNSGMLTTRSASR